MMLLTEELGIIDQAQRSVGKIKDWGQTKEIDKLEQTKNAFLFFPNALYAENNLQEFCRHFYIASLFFSGLIAMNPKSEAKES